MDEEHEDAKTKSMRTKDRELDDLHSRTGPRSTSRRGREGRGRGAGRRVQGTKDMRESAPRATSTCCAPRCPPQPATHPWHWVLLALGSPGIGFYRLWYNPQRPLERPGCASASAMTRARVRRPSRRQRRAACARSASTSPTLAWHRRPPWSVTPRGQPPNAPNPALIRASAAFIRRPHPAQQFMSTVLAGHMYDGAIMLTASHLPSNRNGLKFFTATGGLESADITAVLLIASQLDVRPTHSAPISPHPPPQPPTST